MTRIAPTNEDMRPSSRFVPVVCLLLGLLFGASHALAAITIKDATSPDGKFTLTATSTPDSGCRVEIKRKAGDHSLTQVVLERFYEEDSRYSIAALWKPDSSAVAINVNEGRNNSYCRVLAEDHGEWKELTIPAKPLAEVRKKGNTSDGKAQEFVAGTTWAPGNKLELSYQGNSGLKYGLIFELSAKSGLHLEYRQTVEPGGEGTKKSTSTWSYPPR